MILKRSIRDDRLPWQREPYHLAARYKEISPLDGLDGSHLFYVEIEEGGRILPHATTLDELLFCLAGSGRFTLDDEETELREGESLLAPRGGVQGLVNEGSGPMRLLLLRGAAPPLGVRLLWRLMGRA